MRIGIAGVGRMGAAIGERLLELGHELVVWNRSPGKVEGLAAKGATVAANPAALAAQCETVLTILTNAAAMTDVYEGPNGLLAGDVGGRLFIEMSTVQPDDQRRLAEKVSAKGASYVECPVGGTTGPARQGKLLGLAGGDAADVARARPLLDQLCRRVEHLGPVGSGAAMKLAINLPLLVAYQALGEAYVLCRDIGLDSKAIMDIFADTSGAPSILKIRGAAIAETLAGRESGPPAFDIDSIRKDLRTMLAEAKAKGAALPLVERTLAIYDQAAAEGWGSRDGTWLPAYWPKLNTRC
jgi:3-hydroxyisobutyrate dehydrogenase